MVGEWHWRDESELDYVYHDNAVFVCSDCKIRRSWDWCICEGCLRQINVDRRSLPITRHIVCEPKCRQKRETMLRRERRQLWRVASLLTTCRR